jgi:hypothetical protein
MRKPSAPPARPAKERSPARKNTAAVAHPLPGRASTNQAVSSAAERLGADDDGTMQGSDWMAERRVAAPGEPGAKAPSPLGTPITSENTDSARQGRARESRRGSY